MPFIDLLVNPVIEILAGVAEVEGEINPVPKKIVSEINAADIIFNCTDNFEFKATQQGYLSLLGRIVLASLG